jgi:hypothetical protein
MAKWLSDEDTDNIVQVILKWPLWKLFGWEQIRKEIKTKRMFPEVDEVWSRQQLQKYANIKNAFITKKKQVRVYQGRNQSKDSEDLPPRERLLQEQVATLKAKVLHLTDMIDGFHERFERHIYNAYAKGITRELLEMPLPLAAVEKKKKGGNHGR